MKKKTDLRVVRTNESIRKAFYELIQEMGYESITIQNIADRARVNRNTFYLHYQDKPDLLDKCMDELLQEVRNTIVLCPVNMRPFNIFKLETVMQAMLEHISHNTSYYHAMLIGENRIYLFRSKMESIIRDKLNEGWSSTQETSTLTISKELLLEYLVSSFMGIIIWWIENNLPLSVKEVSTQFSQIVAYGYLKSAGIKVKE